MSLTTSGSAREWVLRQMCGARAPPRFVFSDRGPGFYNASTGAIVGAYKDALTKNKLKPFAGEDASWQPSDLADLFMHETAAAWARKYFQACPVEKCADIKKNWRRFDVGLKQCEKHINKHHDVRALCRALPARLRKLRASGGDRLRY